MPRQFIFLLPNSDPLILSRATSPERRATVSLPPVTLISTYCLLYRTPFGADYLINFLSSVFRPLPYAVFAKCKWLQLRLCACKPVAAKYRQVFEIHHAVTVYVAADTAAVKFVRAHVEKLQRAGTGIGYNDNIEIPDIVI